MSFVDLLGDRMKYYEGIETDRRLDARCLPVYARLDGRGFSKFTRGMKRPYDLRMTTAMIETARYLVDHTKARIGYTQSDEISLFWSLNGDNPETQMMFDGKMQKLTSVLAGMATARFMKAVLSMGPEFAEYAERLPHFDCRVFTLPSREEAANAFLWRANDAERNAIQMAAQSHFSHTRLQGVSQTGCLDMMTEAGIDMEDYPRAFRLGTFLRREQVRRPLSKEELLVIPAEHRPEDGTEVIRSEVVQVPMPRFRLVTNRVDVIYNGAAPQTAEPWFAPA